MPSARLTAIVDYGVGNVHSVRVALEAVGAEVNVTSSPRDLLVANRIVLPGVGAFGACMARLSASSLLPALEEAVLVEKKPFLGICVGMQVLASSSEEGGAHLGLGWIPGRVRRLSGSRGARVPHVGWSDTPVTRDHPVLVAPVTAPTFYYSHSFVFEPTEAEATIASCPYAGGFVAAVARDNIIGTQFHPEKSQADGFALLERFVRWVPLPNDRAFDRLGMAV